MAEFFNIRRSSVWVLLAGVLLLGFAPRHGEAATTVVVVRHAEKMIEPGNRDPELSAAGVERAEALRRMLRDLPVDAVYSSDYIRTRETAAPIATEAGVEVQLRDPRDPVALRDEILRDRLDGTVVVVGHSNTVGPMLAALGVAEVPVLTERDYDDCFIAVVPDQVEGEPRGVPVLLHLHFGAVSD